MILIIIHARAPVVLKQELTVTDLLGTSSVKQVKPLLQCQPSLKNVRPI